MARPLSMKTKVDGALDNAPYPHAIVFWFLFASF
jgi:hypothetical protein